MAWTLNTFAFPLLRRYEDNEAKSNLAQLALLQLLQDPTNSTPEQYWQEEKLQMAPEKFGSC